MLEMMACTLKRDMIVRLKDSGLHQQLNLRRELGLN